MRTDTHQHAERSRAAVRRQQLQLHRAGEALWRGALGREEYRVRLRVICVRVLRAAGYAEVKTKLPAS